MGTSEPVTKSLGTLLSAMRKHAGSLVDEGIVEPGQLRLTVASRDEKAKQLVDSGLSKRQAAKVLAVNEKTIRNAVRNNSAQDAENIRSSRKAIRRKNEELANVPAAAPRGIFETIVIDPPWPMTKIERDVRPNQVEFDYPIMSADELRAFANLIESIAADSCHMFMWTTQKFLPLAMELIGVYGFRYVLTMVWHKAGGYQPTGLPQFNCEFAIYSRKGTPKFIDTKGFPCCFNAPRREHSRKPDEFYDIVSLVTSGPRIDIFSREQRDGFEQFGNETSKFSGGGA